MSESFWEERDLASHAVKRENYRVKEGRENERVREGRENERVREGKRE